MLFVSASQRCDSAMNVQLSPPHPVPPLWVVTEHQAELPVLYRNFPRASYWTQGSVYVTATRPIPRILL